MSDVTPMVFIVDHDRSERESVAALIQAAGLQSKVFGSAREFLAHPPISTPCCLVLDLVLPDLHGLELQARLAISGSEIPIIFLTSCGDIPSTVQAMKAGAQEFLTKPYDASVLLSAVLGAVAHSRAALAREAEFRTLCERRELLSAREREVMDLIVRGYLNKQVGFELGISEVTVKVHRGKVMRKMQAGSLAALTSMSAELRPPGSATQPFPGWDRPDTLGPSTRPGLPVPREVDRKRNASAALIVQ
jgi:FixJ family two-component response regulator